MSDQPEIHVAADGPVDVDAIMRQIRDYLLARKAQADGTPLPHFTGRFDAAVYDQLARARLLQNKLAIAPNVIPSHAPIIGPLLNLIRRQFHQLTLYYVNQLAQKQATFNTHLLGALTLLIQELETLPVADPADAPTEIAAPAQN